MDIVAIDLDGTFLNSDHQISSANKQEVRRIVEDGVVIAIATGRSVFSVREIVGELDISAYVLALNGTYIAKIDVEGEMTILKKSILDKKVIDESLSLAADHNITFIASNEYGSDRVPFSDTPELVQEFLNKRLDLQVITKKEMARKIRNPSTEYLKLAFTDTNVKKLRTLQKALSEKGITTIFSDTCYIEVVPEGCNKGNALSYLCDKLNIPLANSVSIGDQENDIEMLEMSGTGVVMGNATPHIKEFVDVITDTNDNDGVAKILQRLKKIAVSTEVGMKIAIKYVNKKKGRNQ